MHVSVSIATWLVIQELISLFEAEVTYYKTTTLPSATNNVKKIYGLSAGEFFGSETLTQFFL